MNKWRLVLFQRWHVGRRAAGLRQTALRFKRFKLSYGYVFLSREFQTQRGTQTYATFNLSFIPAD